MLSEMLRIVDGAMKRSVTVSERGREGHVQYTAPEGSINGHWEFGADDVVAILSMGTREEWMRSHPWAVEQRAEILRYIGDQVVQRRAPYCTPEVDEERGTILLRQTSGPRVRVPGTAGSAPTAQEKSAAFVRRFTNLKAMFALGLLVAALVVGGIYWMGKKVSTVTAANGIPLNECVRTDQHIASLIQTTDPHAIDISGRGGNSTTSVSIVLIPLDGSAPYVVPVASGLNGNSLGLSRIFGSDGHTLWFDAAGLHGVRLSDHALIGPEALREANPSVDATWWDDPRGMHIVNGRLYAMRIDRSAALTVDPATLKTTDAPVDPSRTHFQGHDPTDHLAAGLIVAPKTWLALLSADERAGEFKEGKFIKPVENADDAKQLRRLCSAELEPSSDGSHHKIIRIAPITDSDYLNAAFLRMTGTSEPIRLNDPESALMVHTSAPGLQGTLIVSRVDMNGKLVWSSDTGLDRFALKQILPGADAFAFVGTRPMVEGKLSEPLVVLVDTGTGKLTSHTLWR